MTRLIEQPIDPPDDYWADAPRCERCGELLKDGRCESCLWDFEVDREYD